MAEKKKLIKQAGDISLYKENVDFTDGSAKDFYVLCLKKTKNFVKDSKGGNMFNVTYDKEFFIPLDQIKNVNEVTKGLF